MLKSSIRPYIKRVYVTLPDSILYHTIFTRPPTPTGMVTLEYEWWFQHVEFWEKPPVLKVQMTIVSFTLLSLSSARLIRALTAESIFYAIKTGTQFWEITHNKITIFTLPIINPSWFSVSLDLSTILHLVSDIRWEILSAFLECLLSLIYKE